MARSYSDKPGYLDEVSQLENGESNLTRLQLLYLIFQLPWCYLGHYGRRYGVFIINATVPVY